MQVGQTVIAIGYSLGQYPNSVTKGVISGISRDVVAGDTQGQAEQLSGVIQTDAAINPGNSGGPLLDIQGQVIGINTAIDQQGQLIGFSIPINEVVSAVKSVETSGRVIRAYLGVRYVNIDADIAQQDKLPVSAGAYLQAQGTGQPAVVPGSPADKAGLKEGDIITAINGQKLTSTFSLGQAISKSGVGDKISLTILRAGKTITVEVTLAERPNP